MEENSATKPEYVPVIFKGETGEYFRIWIVNMALTIVTLGIYSAWATVRKRRYFYTKTSLAEGVFDFHANPKAILFGRVIALAMLGLYLLSSYLNPIAPLAVIVFIFLAAPWLIVRSRIFRMRNSSYRGIRFNFDRNYGEAFKVYYLSTLLTIVTFGLATGSAIFMRNRFAVSNSGFGKTNFTFKGEASVYVGIFWKSIGLTILVVFAYLLLMLITGPLLAPSEPGATPDLITTIIGMVTVIPLFLMYAAVGVYFRVRLQNYVWNAAELGENQFLSSMSVTEMVFIYLTNILAIVFSLGLLTPWAQIRLARYRAEHMHVRLAADWENYVAAGKSEGSAIGDELGEAFDVDVDIGF